MEGVSPPRVLTLSSVRLRPICAASTDWAWCCWSLTTWWSCCSTPRASSTSATRTSRKGSASSLVVRVVGVRPLTEPASPPPPPARPVQVYSVGAPLCHRPPPHPHTLGADVWLRAAAHGEPGLLPRRRQLQRAHDKASARDGKPAGTHAFKLGIPLTSVVLKCASPPSPSPSG